MTDPQILALSLLLSLMTAAVALIVFRLLETAIKDARLRDWLWGLALYTCCLPPFLIGLLLILPRPTEVAKVEAAVIVQMQMNVGEASDGLPSVLTTILDQGPTVILGLAVCACALRSVLLLTRMRRLRQLLEASETPPLDLNRLIGGLCKRMDIAVPEVRSGPAGSTAFVTGLCKATLVVPSDLANDDQPEAVAAILIHELAHLKRGDLLSMWLEEVLLTLLAINPLLPHLRSHRAAAREEACDQYALIQADTAQRQQYARLFVAALRQPAGSVPALTFTSQRRKFAMRRLKAILSSAPTRPKHPALILGGLSLVVLGVASAGSLAIAAQRSAVLIESPDAPAVPPASTLDGAPAPSFSQPDANVSATSMTPGDRREAEPAVPAEPAQPVEPVEPEAQAIAPSRLSVVTNPGWSLHPRPEYPAQALSAGIEGGTVNLSCTAQSDGRLANCSVVEETPPGQGFGMAALAAARNARLSPRTIDDAATGAQVRFTMRFRLG